ncbi:MAG TPA: hypothetical protein P5218_14600, partial [Planctomycetota bacterium]|nr:hypothetical protein [Planctomycetota bacterium]
QGRWLLFWPQTVSAADLTGGGYQPGQVHRVHVEGFPALGGLRTREGVPLDKTYWIPFEVANPGPEDAAFLDFTPYACAPIQFMALPGAPSEAVHVDEPLRLYCGEPLDPRTLHSEDFVILRHRLSPGPAELASEPYCQVRASLIENRHSELLEQHQAGAIVELVPQIPLELDPGVEYSLEVLSTARLADYSGHRPWAMRQPGAVLASYRFRLEPIGAHERNHLRIDFLTRALLTSQRVPWATGEASWEPGRITVHFPKAAGTGLDGPVVWEGNCEAADLHATRLSVAASSEVTLVAPLGPVVLRSQGRSDLLGKVRREGAADQAMTPGQWFERSGGGSLEELVAYAQAESMPWTILVAGGDLLLEGEFVSQTPVVLAAGGRTRITGRIQCPPGELYVVGEGGGWSRGQEPRSLPLGMETPTHNPLRERQVYCLLSSVVPNWALDRYEWQSLAIGQDPGQGRTEVFFLPPDGPIERERCVTHPRHLPLDAPLRILIQLTVEPGGSWDPPVIDS